MAVVMHGCSSQSNVHTSLGQKEKEKREKPAVHVNIALSVVLTDTVALLYESQWTYLLLFKLLPPLFFNSCSLLLLSLPLFLQPSPSFLHLLFILKFCSPLLLQYLLFSSSLGREKHVFNLMHIFSYFKIT